MLVSWLLTTSSSLLLYLTGFFSVFTPLPIASLWLRRGWWAGALAFVVALSLLFGLYHVAGPSTYPQAAHVFWSLPLMNLAPNFTLPQVTFLGLVQFGYYGVIGLLLAGVHQTKKLEQGVGLVVLGVTLFVGLVFFLFHQLFHESLLFKVRETFQAFFNQWVQSNDLQGKQEWEGLITNMPAFLDSLFLLMPAFFINGTIITAALNIMILKRWLLDRRCFCSWGEFSQWKLPETWIWSIISIGAGYFLNFYFFHHFWVNWILLNLLLIQILIYFFQGLAVVAFFWRQSWSPLARLAAYFVFFILFQLVSVVIVLTGIFNFWFDFRKLKRNSTPAT